MPRAPAAAVGIDRCTRVGVGSVNEPTLRERLAATAPNRRRTLLRDHVRQLAAKVLGLARADELNVDEPLRQLGLDSLMAVELRNLLGKAVGKTLPATITFDHPSVSALVDHLAGDGLRAELDVPASLPRRPSPRSADAVALHRRSRHEDETGRRNSLSRLDEHLRIVRGDVVSESAVH